MTASTRSVKLLDGKMGKMTRTKPSFRKSGCLVRRESCPCGYDQCYVKVEGIEDDTAEIVGLSDSNLLQGTHQTTSEVATVDTAPYVGQSFPSDVEAEEYYSNFARKSGFAIRRERSKGSQSHPLGVYRREFVCHRAGSPLPRKTEEVKRQRNKVSSRCKCEAQMIIKKNVGLGVTRWVVVQFSNVHSHEMLDSKDVRFLPAYRNISAVDRERILALSNGGCTVNLIMKALEMEKEVKPGDLTFTVRDVRNLIQNSKNINPENEASELLKVCKAVKDKSPDFCYEYSMGENNKLEHISWLYGDSIRAYGTYGDVVVFDATHRFSAYNRTFGVWLGLDNHGNTIFFGCVLLRDETPKSFKWALQSFLLLVNGEPPQTVLTDQDLGLRDALMSEWPNTKHVCPIWHIAPRLSSWFSFNLGAEYERFKSEFHRIYNLETVEEFDHQWSQMVLEFGLTTDRHIDVLFSDRSSWALPYLRGCFSAGLTAAQYPVSTSSFFKEYLNSQICLKDFVGQVCLAVDFQVQAAEEATMQKEYQDIKIKTCMPIEEHASTVLTAYAFDMLQTEIGLSLHYAVFETTNDIYLVRHHLQTDGGHIVSWTPLDEEIHCSCKLFESSGILCGHAIRVLSLKNYFHVPEKYMPMRWRRESTLFPKQKVANNYRSRALHTLAAILVQESSTTRKRFEYVHGEMIRLLTHVRDMPTIDESALNLDPTLSVDGTMENVPNGVHSVFVVNPPNSVIKQKRKSLFRDEVEQSKEP